MFYQVAQRVEKVRAAWINGIVVEYYASILAGWLYIINKQENNNFYLWINNLDPALIDDVNFEHLLPYYSS